MYLNTVCRVFVGVLRGQTKKSDRLCGRTATKSSDFGEIELTLEKIERFWEKSDANRAILEGHSGHLGSCDAYCFYCFRPGLTFTSVCSNA